jgi:hypothetical protein
MVVPNFMRRFRAVVYSGFQFINACTTQPSAPEASSRRTSRRSATGALSERDQRYPKVSHPDRLAGPRRRNWLDHRLADRRGEHGRGVKYAVLVGMAVVLIDACPARVELMARPGQAVLIEPARTAGLFCAPLELRPRRTPVRPANPCSDRLPDRRHHERAVERPPRLGAPEDLATLLLSGATVILSLASLGCSVAALRYGSAGLALVGLGLGLLACLILYMLERP